MDDDLPIKYIFFRRKSSSIVEKRHVSAGTTAGVTAGCPLVNNLFVVCSDDRSPLFMETAACCILGHAPDS